MTQSVSALRFGADVAELPAPPGEWRWRVDKLSLPVIAQTLVRDHGAVFAGLVATRDGRLRHLFNLPEAYLTLESELGAGHLGFPSIAARVPAAAWAEREVQDLFGYQAVGHPDPRALVLPDDWPGHVHPLREVSFDGAPVPPRSFEYARVEGDNVFEVRVGPIHAGVIEPGHFRFAVDGEHVIQLETRLFWTHKGTEQLFEGRTAEAGVFLAERVCGACSVANSLAYCQAVEAIAGVQPSARAQLIRVVLAELERLHNHAGDLAGILTDVAYASGAAHLLRLREQLLRLNAEITGHRLLMGVNVPGGVRCDLPPAIVARLDTLTEIQRALDGILELATADESVLDRLETTGRLARATVEELGVVGPAARAAGVRHDVRKDHPYAAYARLGFDVAVAEKGDVLARLRVKRFEFGQSVSLIRRAIALLPEGPVVTPLGCLQAGAALGWTEGPRGETLFWVEMDADGRLARVKVRSASYMNWPAVPQAVLGNIVPDFPLINKSFNLCYSCTDR